MVRLSRVIPRRCSNPAIRALTVDLGMLSALAARANPMVCTTFTKTLISLRSTAYYTYG